MVASRDQQNAIASRLDGGGGTPPTSVLGRDAPVVGGGPAADDVRVIRRLRPVTTAPRVAIAGTRLALVIDVETTGLLMPGVPTFAGCSCDEVIQFAVRPLTYRISDGAVLALHEPYVGLRQPSRPLSAEVSALTGLTDAMLAGRSLDIEAIARLAAECSLVIAHNAAFDRSFVEALAPVFAELPWACTVEDADWPGEGVESAKLCFVAAMSFGFFYDGHRALDDCDAVAEILSRKAPRAGGFVLAKVLASARRGRWRLRVFQSDYAARQVLKAERFRWDPGARAWQRDFVTQDAAAAALGAVAPLAGSRMRATIGHLDARVRFSNRV